MMAALVFNELNETNLQKNEHYKTNPNYYQKLISICMQMTFVFSTNKRMFKKIENVLHKEFSSLC